MAKDRAIYSDNVISKYRSEIMGIAALWIFVFHEWDVALANVPYISNLLFFAKRIGFCGVDIFLFLSGIGLVYSIQNSTIPQFYYKRLKRIILPYLAIAVLHYFIDGWTPAQFLLTVSGYYFYTRSIYTFLWFIPAIITFYLLFPLYFKIFSLFKRKLVFTISVMLVWLIISVTVANKMRIDLFGFTNRIPIFLFGIYYGWKIKNGRRLLNSKCEVGVYCLAFVIGMILSYLTNYRNLYLLVQVSNCCVPNFLLAISISFLVGKVFQICENMKFMNNIAKILTFYGLVSLELYCVQSDVGNLFLTMGLEKTLFNIIVLATSTIISWLLYKISDKFWKPLDRLVIGAK